MPKFDQSFVEFCIVVCKLKLFSFKTQTTDKTMKQFSKKTTSCFCKFYVFLSIISEVMSHYYGTPSVALMTQNTDFGVMNAQHKRKFTINILN